MDATKNILVAGAGKIGCALAAVLANVNHTQITLVDRNIALAPDFIGTQKNIQLLECEVQNATALFELIKKHAIQAIVSCLPYFYNFSVAEVAKANSCHYFDLTEDVETARDILTLAENADTAFVPQCGIAPGFINTLAANLIQQCDTVDSVKLYCGALPQKPENILGYALTWSTEGLINEYVNLCRILQEGTLKTVPGLSGLEELIINNEIYEAFHTSGGIGTLIDTYKDKINTMHYKSVRYPGHCEKIRFLTKDLKLSDDRETLKKILENALPTTSDDFVITHVKVCGIKNNQPLELTDTRHFYPNTIINTKCSAIQYVTSHAAAATINTVLSNPKNYHGPIKQEDFDLDAILSNSDTSYLKGS